MNVQKKSTQRKAHAAGATHPPASPNWPENLTQTELYQQFALLASEVVRRDKTAPFVKEELANLLVDLENYTMPDTHINIRRHLARVLEEAETIREQGGGYR